MFFLNTWACFVLILEVPVDFRCLEAYVCLQGGRSAQLSSFKERKHRPQLYPSLPTLVTWHFPLATL